MAGLRVSAATGAESVVQFDHRMVDGWNAATFVQRIKGLLETPALLFVDDH